MRPGFVPLLRAITAPVGWRLRLPTAAPADLETEPPRLLTALVKVVLSQSLLSDEAFMHLVEQAFAGGLWHKLFVGRPYDELAAFLGPDDYQTMAALAGPAVGAGTPRGQAKPAALPARTWTRLRARDSPRHRPQPLCRHAPHRALHPSPPDRGPRTPVSGARPRSCGKKGGATGTC